MYILLENKLDKNILDDTLVSIYILRNDFADGIRIQATNVIPINILLTIFFNYLKC
jgi:hypothetical protein